MTSKHLRWAIVLLASGVVGCDHATKYAAESHLEEAGPVVVVPGVLDLRYVENRDTAFSLFRLLGLPSPPALLAGLQLAGLTALGVFWWRRRRTAGLLEHAAWSVTAAGALGNLLDRVLRGYVVDFIHLHHWPVFNVADAALLVGMGLLILVFGVFGRPAATSAGPSADGPPPG
ncbi:MAG: signal peptidase II [Deltaproteobacteria bacterium]|nr:signal peptidase II [Deltaproteobacteria bacterium]